MKEPHSRAACWYRRDGDAWLIEVHAQPGAKTSAVAGLHGEALKLRIAAPPVEGRANEALCAFIAHALGVPKAAVSIARGASSRRKQLRVTAPADPRALLPGTLPPGEDQPSNTTAPPTRVQRTRPGSS